MMVLRMKNHTTVVIVVKGRGMEDVKEARKTGVIRGLPSGLTVLESSPHLHPPPHPHPLTTFPWPLFFIAGGRRDWTAIDRERERDGGSVAQSIAFQYDWNIMASGAKWVSACRPHQCLFAFWPG